MKRTLVLSALLVALAACDGQLDPTAGSSTVSIAGGDPSAHGVLNGSVFSSEYGAGYDTLTAPLPSVTVEIYQMVSAEALMGPSLVDTISFDTLPNDTLPVDTLPVDTIVVDTIPNDSLPPTLVLRGSAVTDEEGHFSVTGIPEGEYVIYIKPGASSHWAESSGWVFVSDGSNTSSGTFHVWPKPTSGLD